MQQKDQDRLNGWHAAERGDLFDFRMPKDWQEGHMLWTHAHITHQQRQRPASSRQASSSKSQRT